MLGIVYRWYERSCKNLSVTDAMVVVAVRSIHCLPFKPSSGLSTVRVDGVSDGNRLVVDESAFGASSVSSRGRCFYTPLLLILLFVCL